MSDEQIQQFVALTNTSVNVASDYLNQFGDLGEALNAFYATQQDDQEPKTDASFEQPIPKAASQGELPNSSAKDDVTYARTLSGQKIALPRSTPSPSQKPKSKSRFQSFSDILKGGDDEDEDRNTFAGGETSGLEITDPHANDSNSLIRDLLQKARRGGERAEQEEEENEEAESKKHHFVGKGYRLGSDVSAPPTVVEDDTPVVSKPKKVTREITFWKDGFQVGDGKLYRYDDPENSFYLKELNQGRAPLQLLDVEFGQEVDVTVYKKLEEPYVPPKKKLSGFQGTGKRLGSPIPGEAVNSQSASPAESTPVGTEIKEKSPDDELKGDTSVQIRYASGKREVLRCNSTDTIRFLYQHVKANTTETRPFTLSHAFPVKPIDQFDSTLKDQDLCNAVVVQRWV